MNNKRIESIKNFLIVVLFLTTILLLYLLWAGDIREFKVRDILPLTDDASYAPGVGSVLLPEYVAFGNADSSFNLASGDILSLQNKAIDLLRSASGEVVSREITESQYQSVVNLYNSVQIKTCVDFPGKDFAAFYALNGIDAFNHISHISLIAFSDLSKESAFIYDAVEKKYYRLIFTEPQDYTQELRSIADISDDIYYSSGAVLGGNGKALMPIYTESMLTSVDYETEFESGGRDKRAYMAEIIFGENFDFVRRMTDSFGNITYMYGYGQKVFTANADGSFDYISETDEGTSRGFFNDLEIAMQFAAECGGWMYDNGEPSIMLSEYEERQQGRNVLRKFEFNQYCGGKEICLDGGASLEIIVVNGQVSRMKRNFAVIASYGYATGLAPTSDAANVIAQNCNHIYNVINNTMLAAAAEEAFEAVAETLKSISIAYYRSNKDSSMIPCWKVVTDNGDIFYFDLYTAAPLGFTK